MTREQQVAAGAEWLDAERPGWELLIDLGRLNLASGWDCVCGQVFVGLVEDGFVSGYEGAHKTLFPEQTAVWSEAHGFYSLTITGKSDLQVAWTALIKERFSTGNLSGSEAP